MQATQQHVAPCVKEVHWGLGTRGFITHRAIPPLLRACRSVIWDTVQVVSNATLCLCKQNWHSSNISELEV